MKFFCILTEAPFNKLFSVLADDLLAPSGY
jgi:hypothetical protein